MENMDNTMSVVGIDDELEQEKAMPEEGNVVKMRRPYVEWDVCGSTYKLKLGSSSITTLERRFGKSLLSAVLDDGIPTVTVTITLLQAALQKFHHGFKSYDVERLYDDYIDAGGTQITLLNDVIYPLMGDAGFFTDGQMKLLTKEISEADSIL